MAVIKSLLIRTEVETAKAKRICYRNRKKHSIAANEICLVTINDLGGKNNYCHICATLMLEKAQSDLESIKTRLGASASN